MYAIRCYRLYDIGDEIDLTPIEEAFKTAYHPAQAHVTGTKPKSIITGTPPLKVILPAGCEAVCSQGETLTITASVYDIGAISIVLTLENINAPPEGLIGSSRRVSNQKGLDPVFSRSLSQMGDILRSHLHSIVIEPQFYGDYTIYLIDRLLPEIDTVSLLLGESIEYSDQTREEVLKNSLSYGKEDLSILSWDTALLVGPESPEEMIELIEFANVQLLELRYYDRVLTRQMERMYDDIESADHLIWFFRIRRYHRIMTRLMEVYAEVSEITEKIDNLIKITEDLYYARVYATALKVLGISQWRGGVDRKIDVIRENYVMLSDEVNIQHSHFLEWIIIILIALEFAFAIWEAMG